MSGAPICRGTTKLPNAAKATVKVRRHFAVGHGTGAEKVGQPFAKHRHRLAGVGQLPAHHHHEAKTKEQKRQATEPILDADHLMIGRENVFSPEAELMVLVLMSVAMAVFVRVIAGFNRSRGIHFRKNLPPEYRKRTAHCKA